MFGKKKAVSNESEDTQPIVNQSSSKKKKNTPEQQSRMAFLTVLAVSAGITVISATFNIWSITKYDASLTVSPDTSAVDTIKNFITTENTKKYLDIVAKHTNPEQSKNQDIKTVVSAVGREHPFVAILNKGADNTSTMLFKFIYSELKPAIISYKLANNGALPLVQDTKNIDLTLLETILNVKDESMTNFTYTYVAGTDNNFSLTVKEGDKNINIVLFDVTQFSLKEINNSEASIVQGKYSLILKPMEEYNNIRLEKLDSAGNSVVLSDTITGKVVKITKN